MLEWLLNLPRSIKRMLSVLTDSLLLSVSMFAAIALTQQSDLLYFSEIAIPFGITLSVTLILFIKLGLYRAVIRYMGQHALGVVLLGIIGSAITFVTSMIFFDKDLHPSLVIVYSLFVLVTSGGLRMLARMILHSSEVYNKTKVLIYGAGSSGRQLAQALFNGEQFHPVAFVDDDVSLQRSTILGMNVHSPAKIGKLIVKYEIGRVLLAIPSATRARRREVLDQLSPLPIPVLTIPGMSDLVAGDMSIDELQEVKIEDLLGRDPVAPILNLLHANVKNKVVMVTGAGGSIGSELCRQLIACGPSTLILFEISEYALYQIEQELKKYLTESKLAINVIPLLGSIQNVNRLEAIMRSFAVNTIYHAAAYKHVTLVEYNVVEGVTNNVLGTWATAEAAINAGVQTFVLISTDKAVRPTNVMGASKRFAELILQALAKKQDITRFCMVRFGNVLGSSGSVVPLFQEQIRTGGPVTVTHKEIIRYFMTIPEAAQLVIQAGAMGHGGEVFVLDMGEPVKIFDLAKRMIHLMGLKVKDENTPDGDIEILITGLHSGEKLYEELLVGTDFRATEHRRIMAADEKFISWHELQVMLIRLKKACSEYNVHEILSIFNEGPAEFNYCGIVSDIVLNRSNTQFSDQSFVPEKTSIIVKPFDFSGESQNGLLGVGK